MTAERLFRAQPGRWRTWACPCCGTTIEALAVEVGHHCPSNRRRWVQFVLPDPFEPAPKLGDR